MRSLMVIGVLWASVGQASVVEALGIDELTVRSSTVFEGVVIGASSAWQAGVVVTETKVQVERCFKGACDVEVVTVDSLGGTVGELTMVVDGCVQFQLGERVLLFVREDAHQSFRTVGMSQGKFSLRQAGGETIALRDHQPQRVGPRSDVAEALDGIHYSQLVRQVSEALLPTR